MTRPKETKRDQKLSQTRERLLEAATEEFALNGYAGANVDRISRAAGFAKGTIYNYFPSKRSLLTTLIEEIAKMHFAYIDERISREDDPEDGLRQFFFAGSEFVFEFLPQAQLMVNTLYGHDEDFKQELFQAYLPMFQLVAEKIIGPGVASGVFRPVDPQKISSLLMNIYLGTASQVNEGRRPWIEPELVSDFAFQALKNTEDNIKGKT